LKDGLVGVSKWTTAKGLDIFTKSFLINTVNLNSHSLIVAALHAGMINADLVEDESEDPYNMEQPALVFFDSLKLHDAPVTAKNVRAWLSHEWEKK
jgi:hypothetical protein